MKFLFVYVVFICTFVQLIYLFNLKFNKMKKLLVLSVVAIAAFAFSSCAPKDCTCTAKFTDPEVEAMFGNTLNLTIEGADLKTAGYKNCNDYYEKTMKAQDDAEPGYSIECVEE